MHACMRTHAHIIRRLDTVQGICPLNVGLLIKVKSKTTGPNWDAWLNMEHVLPGLGSSGMLSVHEPPSDALLECLMLDQQIDAVEQIDLQSQDHAWGGFQGQAVRSRGLDLAEHKMMHGSLMMLTEIEHVQFTGSASSCYIIHDTVETNTSHENGDLAARSTLSDGMLHPCFIQTRPFSQCKGSGL